MSRQLEEPSSSSSGGNNGDEGFELVFTLSSFQDCDELLNRWHIPVTTSTTTTTSSAHESASSVDRESKSTTTTTTTTTVASIGTTAAIVTSTESTPLLKFPRTPHLKNLGAATRDDKVLGDVAFVSMLRTRPAGTRLVVEEKIDGANMGISINEQGKIVVQNRSHFITPSYHPQFAPLFKWLADYTADLWEILIPCRHILYGEWCYATHSVEYTTLPSWFVSYDIYDRETNMFLDRNVIEAMLQRTRIPIVPLVMDCKYIYIIYIIYI